MAKRFTDTNKWRKGFIRGLQGAYKLLWLYILDECDHAGIWHVELDVASLRIGYDLNLMETVKIFKSHIIVFDDGNKWFIPDFIEFQYGTLNPANRVHASVIKILDIYGIDAFDSIPLSKEHIRAREEDKVDNSPFTIIFDYWNNANIVTHRAFTTQMKGKINTKLKDYSVEEICNTIDNYSTILKNNKYFFKYKWTLIDFFQRGFDKFFDKETACANYIINKKLSPKSQPVNPSFKKAKVEMKPEE